MARERADAPTDPPTDPSTDPSAGPHAAHPDDPDRWRHEQARVNGVDLHYVTVDAAPEAVDSESEPPLVVLLHGFPEFWYAWRHQLDPLADAGFRVVAPDMRGYNRSSTPAGVASYRVECLVGDVRGLVEHLGYARADVVGHDWGGTVAWETAIRESDLVRRLGILNAPHPEVFERTARRSPRQLLRSWYALFFQVPWLPERLIRAGDFAVVEEMLTDTVNPDAFTERDVARYKAALAGEDTVTAALNYYRAAFREQVRRQVGSLVGGRRDATVRVPTQVIWGERDRALGTELLDGLPEFVPDLRVDRLPDASHWVQADAPERVTELLLDFLSPE